MRRLLAEDAHPWDAPRSRERWLSLVPEELQREADLDLLKLTLGTCPGALRSADLERAARKVERLVRKIGAAMMLEERVGQEFDGIVTGASPKGTYVRLFSPPAEGRVVRNYDGMDVGEKVRVRLIDTDARRGFIDFAGV